MPTVCCISTVLDGLTKKELFCDLGAISFWLVSKAKRMKTVKPKE